MRKVLVISLGLVLLAGNASAATKSPTPTAKAAVTTKATAKPAVSVSSKPTAKSTASAKPSINASVKASVKASATTTKKAVATKKPVVKKSTPKPKAKRTPKLPAKQTPTWPPKGFLKSDDIYAKVPNKSELYNAAGEDATGRLSAQLIVCEKDSSCGALFAGSTIGCNWWEITSDVIGPASDTDSTITKYGTLTSLFSASNAKKVNTYVLVSGEPYNPNFKVVPTKVSCNRGPRPTDRSVPSHTYVKNN